MPRYGNGCRSSFVLYTDASFYRKRIVKDERSVRVKSIKRTLAAALAAGLLVCAAAAMAETKTWREEITVVTGTNVYTAFEDELPADMAKAFPKSVWKGYACVSGIICQAEAQDWRKALVAMEKDGAVSLVGLTGMEGASWQIAAVSEKAILPGRSFAFAGSDRDDLSIVYPCEDGGEETFTFAVRRQEGGAVNQFIMEQYTRTYKDGRRVSVSGRGSQGSFFDVKTTLASGDPIEEYIPCITSTYLEDLDAQAFPKTITQVRAYAQDAPAFTEEKQIAAVNVAATGLNLRYGPGTSTDSMGKYYNGTLVQLLRRMPDTASGGGWWRVKVGQMEGYMSEAYLSQPTTESIAATLQRGHLPVAQAKKDIELLAGMTATPCEYTKVKKGTFMHVLGYTDQWLHVSVPQGEFSFMMELDAPTGYVRVSDVAQGPNAYLAEDSSRW